MKITTIEVFHVTYGLKDRKYAWSGGHAVTSFLSNVVKVSTDEGVAGFAEVCPLGGVRWRQLDAGEIERRQPLQSQLRRQARHAADVHHGDARDEPHRDEQTDGDAEIPVCQDQGLAEQLHGRVLTLPADDTARRAVQAPENIPRLAVLP